MFKNIQKRSTNKRKQNKYIISIPKNNNTQLSLIISYLNSFKNQSGQPHFTPLHSSVSFIIIAEEVRPHQLVEYTIPTSSCRIEGVNKQLL